MEKIRTLHIVIPMQVPVIVRNELLEVHTGGVTATVLVQMVEGHLFLKIQAKGILTTKRRLVCNGQCEERRKQGSHSFHGTKRVETSSQSIRCLPSCNFAGLNSGGQILRTHLQGRFARKIRLRCVSNYFAFCFSHSARKACSFSDTYRW